MPLVTFKKDGYGHKAGDVGELPDDDFEFLSKKGVVEKADEKPVREMILKALDEGFMPEVTKGMSAIFDSFTKGVQERIAGVKTPTVKVVGDDGASHDDPVLKCKSANELFYPHLYGSRPAPHKKTQDVFSGFGEFALHAKTWRPGGRLTDKMEQYVQLVNKSEDYEPFLSKKADPTGLGEAIGSEAGILVPPEYSTRIFERVYSNPLLQMTDTYPIRGNQICFPAIAERSRVAGSRQGGVRGYWKDEAQQYTATKPSLREVKLEPSKLTVLVWATEELLEDSPVLLDQFLSNKSVEEINFKVGEAIYRGTGVGQPKGLINETATISVSKETGQAATTIVSENILKMWSRMYGPSRRNSVWFYNQDVEPQLNQMSLSVGTGGVLTYSPPGGLSMAPFATLMGRPMIPLEFCSTLGTVGDIMLADMSQYITATRGTIKSAMSMHLRFDYDEVAWKFSFRIDGRSWWDTSLTPYLGSNTQSPFVVLATRS